MDKIEFTRKQYLNSECTHRQYYAQFVTDGMVGIVAKRFGIEALRRHLHVQATDVDYLSHPEYIKLEHWDHLPVWSTCSDLLRQAGDYLTLAGIVCLYKEAAKQAVERAEL